jgi:1-acyl-sn-glycerol-3-phosphate acyltransferase
MAKKDRRADAPAAAARDGALDPEVLSELRDALGGLRSEIRTRFPTDRRAEERTPGETPQSFDFEALFQAARRRLGTFGMVERSADVDEFGMEEVVLRRSRPLLDFLFDQYWRAELAGLENLPERGPCLLVANHSGLLPWDGLMLSHAVARRHPHRERPRFLVADWLMRLPFAHATLAQLGGVRACPENAERLLASGRFVAAFPEGAEGATKVFADRYRLQGFGGSDVMRLAVACRAPVLPVGIVGAEEVNPLLVKWSAPARRLGLPFLPVTPTFPLLGPLGLLPLPSRWVIRIGEPIPIDSAGPDAAEDPLRIARLTQSVRARIESLIDAALHDRESPWPFP